MGSEKIVAESISADLLAKVSDILQGAKVLKIVTTKEYKEELLKFVGEDKKIFGVLITPKLDKKEIQIITKDSVLTVKIKPKTKETISFDLSIAQFEKLKAKAAEGSVEMKDIVKKIILKSM